MHKRGQIGWKPFIWVGGVIVVITLMYFLVNSGLWVTLSKDLTIDTTVQGFENTLGTAFKWMNYVFGGVPAWLDDRVGATSAIVITILTFFFLFITFGDILQQFSSFSPPVAWISALIVAIIAANLKAIVVILGFFIGIFAFLGGLAVIVGMLAAIAAFFAVNWGIGSLGPWVLRRRVMMAAEKEASKSIAGGKKLAGTIRGMKEAGEALAE